jgi:hypothetical protein
MSTAIHVENLSKAYRIGLKEELPNTFVGAVAGALTAPLRKRSFSQFAERSRPGASQYSTSAQEWPHALVR